jgi:hypothetical protein
MAIHAAQKKKSFLAFSHGTSRSHPHDWLERTCNLVSPWRAACRRLRLRWP